MRRGCRPPATRRSMRACPCPSLMKSRPPPCARCMRRGRAAAGWWPWARRSSGRWNMRPHAGAAPGCPLAPAWRHRRSGPVRRCRWWTCCCPAPTRPAPATTNCCRPSPTAPRWTAPIQRWNRAATARTSSAIRCGWSGAGNPAAALHAARGRLAQAVLSASKAARTPGLASLPSAPRTASRKSERTSGSSKRTLSTQRLASCGVRWLKTAPTTATGGT